MSLCKQKLIQPKQNPTHFWPWGKVQNRIENGEEDNVQWYYYNLVEKTEAESPSLNSYLDRLK